DRAPEMMCIRDRHVERVAHDVDRPRGDAEIDSRKPAVDDERLMGLDEDKPVVRIHNTLLYLMPGRGDTVAVFIARLESEHVRIILLADIRGRETIHLVYVLHILFARNHLGDVV